MIIIIILLLGVFLVGVLKWSGWSEESASSLVTILIIIAIIVIFFVGLIQFITENG